MMIAKETAKRIVEVLDTDCPIENKELRILCEMTIILAGLLDAKLAELGAEDED